MYPTIVFREASAQNGSYTLDDNLITIVPLLYLSRSIDAHDYHFRATQRITVRLLGSVLFYFYLVSVCLGFFIARMHTLNNVWTLTTKHCLCDVVCRMESCTNSWVYWTRQKHNTSVNHSTADKNNIYHFEMCEPFLYFCINSHQIKCTQHKLK